MTKIELMIQVKLKIERIIPKILKKIGLREHHYKIIRNLISLWSIYKLVINRFKHYNIDQVNHFLRKNQIINNKWYLFILSYIFSKNHLELYKIKNTSSINSESIKSFSNPKSYPNFQVELEIFKKNLIESVNRKENKTFYKFGDGDYYFLKKQPFGSARPGRRALGKSYNEINHSEFIDGVLKNDYIMLLIHPELRKLFFDLFPERKIDYPTEYSYALVANKWFFRNFKGKIGLIGAKEKLLLIEQLLKHKKYRKYLEINSFNDYIYIPQRYACDDVDSLKKSVCKQLINSTSDIFLVGIGHVKSAVLHEFKKYKEAIYMDVGCGIDAIAGVINIYRPFFGKWINFRIKSFDYSIIDTMRYRKNCNNVFL